MAYKPIDVNTKQISQGPRVYVYTFEKFLYRHVWEDINYVLCVYMDP